MNSVDISKNEVASKLSIKAFSCNKKVGNIVLVIFEATRPHLKFPTYKTAFLSMGINFNYEH